MSERDRVTAHALLQASRTSTLITDGADATLLNPINVLMIVCVALPNIHLRCTLPSVPRHTGITVDNFQQHCPTHIKRRVTSRHQHLEFEFGADKCNPGVPHAHIRLLIWFAGCGRPGELGTHGSALRSRSYLPHYQPRSLGVRNGDCKRRVCTRAYQPRHQPQHVQCVVSDLVCMMFNRCAAVRNGDAHIVHAVRWRIT